MNGNKRLTNTLALIFSVIMLGLAVVWMGKTDAFAELSFSGDNAAWYFVRATGITAYVLLALSTLWGLAVSSTPPKARSPQSLSMRSHVILSWLGVALALGHGLLLLLDDHKFSYSLADVLVPFANPYRPVATALGVLAFWIMLLVALSIFLKKQLGPKWWKWLHKVSYVAFVFATIHGLRAGTDSDDLKRFFGVSIALTVIMLVYRFTRKNTGGPQKPPHA